MMQTQANDPNVLYEQRRPSSDGALGPSFPAYGIIVKYICILQKILTARVGHKQTAIYGHTMPSFFAYGKRRCFFFCEANHILITQQIMIMCYSVKLRIHVPVLSCILCYQDPPLPAKDI